MTKEINNGLYQQNLKNTEFNFSKIIDYLNKLIDTGSAFLHLYSAKFSLQGNIPINENNELEMSDSNIRGTGYRVYLSGKFDAELPLTNFVTVVWNNSDTEVGKLISKPEIEKQGQLVLYDYIKNLILVQQDTLKEMDVYYHDFHYHDFPTGLSDLKSETIRINDEINIRGKIMTQLTGLLDENYETEFNSVENILR